MASIALLKLTLNIGIDNVARSNDFFKLKSRWNAQFRSSFRYGPSGETAL